MSSTPHDPFYSSPFGPFYRRHTPYMVQPEYRIYEMNKRLQLRSEVGCPDWKNMNKRRHKGLQQLSSLAASGQSLLGPVKSHKFIVDEHTQECALTCSAFRLLESLDLSSAVGQLLNETVQVHNKMYRTGTTTLLFLVGAWSNAALECLVQGIPVSVVVSVMSEGLCSCIEEVASLQLALCDIWKQNEPKSPQQCPIKARSTGTKPLVVFQKEKMLEDVVSQKMVTCHPCKNNVGCHSNTSDPSGNALSTVLKANLFHQTSRNGFLMETTSQRVKLTHSRHFQNKKQLGESSESGCTQELLREFTNISVYWNDLEPLTEGLSHGNSHCMKLVRDAAKIICQKAGSTIDIHSTASQYNVSKIVICSLPGLSQDHCSVHSGYVKLVSTEQASVAVHLQNKPLQVLVVEGDLTENYRHLGFNTSSSTKIVYERINNLGSASEDSWTNSAFSQITQSDVNLILVKGIVSVNLIERCIPSNILVISNVDQNVLKAFCEATGAIPVSYLSQVNRGSLGKCGYVNILRTVDLSTVELGHAMLICIKATDIPLVTAVLCTPIGSKMQVMEDQFWTCAHRLHNAIVDQNVFLGGGAVELMCLNHLRKLEEQYSAGKDEACSRQFHNASSWLAASALGYKSYILRAMADSWYRYLSCVMCNTTKCMSHLDSRTFIQNHLQNLAGCDSPSAYIFKEFIKEESSICSLDLPCKVSSKMNIYDNVTAKEEAWRRALDLVLLVLQTDHEIISSSSTQTRLLHSDDEASDYQCL